MRARSAWTCAGLLALVQMTVIAQRSGAFGGSRDHPAISYSSAETTSAVAAANRRLESGALTLSFHPESGYLRSVLDAFAIPVESQVLVYSETSFQARRINRKNPRAVFFNDHVAIGWVRGGDILEVAVQDPTQGTIYYTLSQTPSAKPSFTRNDQCLGCHLSWETLAVPGPFVLTTFPRRADDEYANGFHVDHRSPMAERWSGWYVTGARVPGQMGNMELLQPKMPPTGPVPVPAKITLEGEFDLKGYPTPFSDVVALMVLDHQARATNLITRAGWEFRQAVHDAPDTTRNGRIPARVREAVNDLVDYFLFVDEAPLPSPVRGSAGFAERFAAEGPRDKKGRSLRDLQLDARMMRYPCSYMIYSPGYAGLPPEVKTAVSQRLEGILTATAVEKKYAHLTRADRTAVLEILRETGALQ